jgi:diguanylate cyclase (GGDEF)-like protein/PAS domain S-box-containing protein
VHPADPDRARPPGPGEDFYRVLLEEHTDIVVVLGEDGVIRYATPSAALLFGSGSIVGARLPDLVGEDSRADVAAAVDNMLGRTVPHPPPGTEGIWPIASTDGRNLDVAVRSSDLRGTPAVSGLVLTLRDVTAQRNRENEMQRRTSYDRRTGLLNDAEFEKQLTHAVTLARGNGTTAALMFVDLDHFKVVNDTYGHLAGDELLAAAGRRLAGAVRESDTVGRWGGDEFTVLLENLPGPGAAGPFADRIVQAFSGPFALSAGRVTIGVSVGIATTADSADTAGLLAHADLALYAVKNAGRGAWRAYDAATTGSMSSVRRSRVRDRARLLRHRLRARQAGPADAGDEMEPGL